MRETGQIYIPAVNWGLFVAIVLAVVLFRSSSNLAAAYGIAVTLDMLITTMLTFFVIRYALEATRWRCASPPPAVFFVVDLAFFASNLLKLLDGGWFPLLIGGGDVHADDDLEARAAPSSASKLRERRHRPARASWTRCSSARRRGSTGTAVFLTAETGTVPNAMLHNLKHNKVLHEHNLFVTVRNHEVPWIGHGQARRDRVAGPRLLAGARCTTASRTTPTCRARWSASGATAASSSR